MNRILVTGVVGAAFVAVALGLNFYVNRDAPPPVAAVPDAPEAMSGGPRETAGADDAAAPPAEADFEPAFDIVRISPEGSLVIAGRAPPDSQVTVRAESGGVVREIGTAVTTARGEWVLLSENTRFTGETALTLQVRNPDGTVQEAAGSVLVAIPDAASQPLVILTSRAQGGASRVLQMPQGAESGPAGDGLSVTVVDYIPDGQITLSGQAPPGAVVNVWLDGPGGASLHLGQASASGAGDWRLHGGQPVPEGRYTLRVRGGEGPAGELKLPFERLGAAALARFGGKTVFVVQPGNNLWQVARRTLGEGLAYTVIYEANRQRILNPDLIYPGQIFQLPGQ